ncbi:helix-turn-helix domain-containing protein [Mesorhizobium sp.]|uniref:MarR family winged helix-turn-helix transcriptional regulator n=1 Tax=Mesorhizobium sp. TaxID=1871066 RepID=UPI0025C3B78C|nr:helix-turn-helix domain-containing protein [Mesorhizobium sp.]
MGFATAQLPVLAGLQSGNALTQAELTKLAGVEQSSMAQLLARMDRDGIIRRTPDPHDGRSSLVELSDKALDRFRRDGKFFSKAIWRSPRAFRTARSRRSTASCSAS